MILADMTIMTTLQRTLGLLALLLSSASCMAADEPAADAPQPDPPVADAPVADSAVADAADVPPLVQLWESQAVLNVERDIVAHIVNDEDVVYVQSSAGVVTALNADTGREMWTAQVGRTDEVAMPATSNASIVMVVAGPALYALDKFSGKELFSYRLPSHPSAGPVITEGSFFVPLADNSLCTCALKTLQYLERYRKLPPGVAKAIAWRFAAGEVIKRAPVAGDSRVGFVTEEGNIHVVDISGVKAGRSKFQFLMKSPATAPLTLVTRDQEYLFAAAANNRLYCIGMNTNGRVQWTFPLGQRVSEPITVIGQDVYIVGDEGELLGLGLQSGLPLQTASGAPFALTDVEVLLSVTEKAVYVLDSAGRVVTVNRRTGEAVSKKEYHDLTMPLRNSVTDRLYLSSTSGRVVCLKESGIDFPIYHQNPQRSPIMPEVAKPAPAVPADAENN
jgi:outer membrane protein assembly factor BamB